MSAASEERAPNPRTPAPSAHLFTEQRSVLAEMRFSRRALITPIRQIFPAREALQSLPHLDIICRDAANIDFAYDKVDFTRYVNPAAYRKRGAGPGLERRQGSQFGPALDPTRVCPASVPVVARFTPKALRLLSDELTGTVLREIDALFTDNQIPLGPPQPDDNDPGERRGSSPG